MTPEGSYQEIDGRPGLVFERRLRHPADAVWAAVTDPGELGHWFPAEVEVDLREGGAMTFTFPDGYAPPSSGRVTRLEPGRTFEFTWEEEILRFEIEPADEGCLLRLTTVLADRGAAARDAAGWHVCLNRLERRLEGEDTSAPTSEPTDEWRALYDKYVGAGLPSGAPVPD